MRRFPATVFLMFFYAGVSCQSSNIKDSKIEAVEVFMKSPIMGDDSYRVYYWKNMILYESHYRFDSAVIVMHNDAIKSQLDKRNFSVSQMRTNYFVFEKDSLFDYNFDPIDKRANNLKLPVDSVLKIRTLQSASLDTVISIKATTINWNKNKTELKENYLFPAKDNIPSVNWVLHYSSKLNQVKISFSHLLDSIKGMKLYKVETFIDSFFDKKENKLWPALMYSNEIRKIKVENQQNILLYFHQYEKLVK